MTWVSLTQENSSSKLWPEYSHAGGKLITTVTQQIVPKKGLLLGGGLGASVGMRGGEVGKSSAMSLTLFPDADYNVLTQSSHLLLILLNVSLNTLPMLAIRVIHKVIKQLRVKVRQD